MLELKLEFLLGRAFALCRACAHEGGLYRIVAVHTDDLLGKVGGAEHVVAPRGDGHTLARKHKAEAGENASHIVLGDRCTEESVYLCGIEGDLAQRLFTGIEVYRAVDHVAGAEHLDKLAGAVDGGKCVFGVKSLFEAGGAFGPHALLFGGYADRRAEEVCTFEHYGGGAVGYLTVCAAHDARKRDSLFVVGDNERLCVEHVILIVERTEFLALCGAAHGDSRAVKALVVKCVHRLTVLKHDIVGDIDDIVDRTHAGRAESCSHPEGRGCDLNVFDDARGVARAEICRVDLYRKIIVYRIAVARTAHLGGVQLKFAVKGDRRLARKTDHREAVGAVGCNLEFDGGIRKAERLADIFAYHRREFLAEDEYAVADGTRHIMLGDVELAYGAEHTV